MGTKYSKEVAKNQGNQSALLGTYYSSHLCSFALDVPVLRSKKSGLPHLIRAAFFLLETHIDNSGAVLKESGFTP